MPSFCKQRSHVTGYARDMRRAMTPQELRLWLDCLKPAPVKVRRQAVVGDFILDFYCAGSKVAFEVDGRQHYEEEGPNSYDAKRDSWLESRGIEVVRFSNREVNEEFEAVCKQVYEKLGVRCSH